MISVIIPMFNAEKSIEKALNSVKAQKTDEEFEIIIINDGSTDKSLEIAEDFKKNNPNLILHLKNQENKGVSAARNAGLKMANGDYIAFLDSDDEWLPHKTEKQLNLLKNENLKIDFLTTFRNNEKITFPYKKNELGLVPINLKKLLLKVTGQTSTAIFKKSVIENTGFFDDHQKYSEDANFWMKVTKKNKMYLLPETLVITGNGKRSFGISGLSANLPEMEKGIQKNIREMYQMNRINTLEFLFFLIFSKLKYGLRILKSKL